MSDSCNDVIHACRKACLGCSKIKSMALSYRVILVSMLISQIRKAMCSLDEHFKITFFLVLVLGLGTS